MVRYSPSQRARRGTKGPNSTAAIMAIEALSPIRVVLTPSCSSITDRMGITTPKKNPEANTLACTRMMLRQS